MTRRKLLQATSTTLPAVISTTAPVPAPPVGAGLPTRGANRFYTGNKAPLQPSAMIPLPPGSVRAEGWLLGQLRREAVGFSGRLPELSKFCDYNSNAWTDRTGHGAAGWEELPYWLKGFSELGYVLNDPGIQGESKRWIEAVLATQQPDGYFGPKTNLTGQNTLEDLNALDLWPNMVMFYSLRSYFEVTGDKRVLSLMLSYFRWMSKLRLEQILPSSWQKWRAGDQLDSIYWLYNRTGESWLLDVARVNHERTSDWLGSIPTWHGVNLTQCFREPAIYFQQSRDPRYVAATERVYDTVMGLYGQVPGGMFGADENARPGFGGPRQGAETCSMAEFMFSFEMLSSITGDGKWADRAEDVAFNSLPASMTPDLKGLHYITAPNQVQLDRTNKAPTIDNSGDMFSYNPFQYRCCQHNAAFAWPYFARSLWMATPGNGLAALFYAPSTVKAKAGTGEVTIRETTDYPFDGVVTLALELAKPDRFPLALRIPGWCEEPKLAINGQAIALPRPEKGFVTVERLWKAGDKLSLTLGMALRMERYPKNRQTVSLHRGPLAFSLRIGERWTSYGDNATWPAHEVFPTTPWNFALDPAALFKVEIRGPVADQPFTPQAAPVVLTGRMRRVPEWQQDANGMVMEVQQSPVRTSQPLEAVELIPMGAARLRISAFPIAGQGAEAIPWDSNPPMVFASSASHFSPPAYGAPYSWPNRDHPHHWIDYIYGKPKPAGSIDVFWETEPANWRLFVQRDGLWQPVQGRPESISGGGFRLLFGPLQTMGLRLEAQPAPRKQPVLKTWTVGAENRG